MGGQVLPPFIIIALYGEKMGIELSEGVKRLVETKSAPVQPAPGNSDLPTACPLATGIVPPGCRFHPKLFARLVTGGVLSADTGCPIIKACGLICQLSKKPKTEATT